MPDQPVNETLAVAGSGAIACGLAAAAAPHVEVTLLARSDQSAERALEHITQIAREGVHLENVNVTTELADVAPATFAVEAISEHMETKGPLLAELHGVLAPEAVLATTTSSLSVAALAEASGRPGHFVGFHVFNPVTKMKLIELAFPPDARGDTRERALALCAALGKTAVEVPDVPGFVVNRLLFPYLFSAVRLLEETELEPEAIDQCMKLGAGHPLGPLALLDMVGLDVSAAIGDEIGADVPERVRALVAEGRLGRKTGSGLYEHS